MRGLCKLTDVDPLEYLADVLRQLTRPIRIHDLPKLLPAAWKAAPLSTVSPSALAVSHASFCGTIANMVAILTT